MTLRPLWVRRGGGGRGKDLMGEGEKSCKGEGKGERIKPHRWGRRGEGKMLMDEGEGGSLMGEGEREGKSNEGERRV